MAKSPKKKAASDFKPEPDAWARFERAMDQVLKSGPQHRTQKDKVRPASKGRVRKGKSRA
jgi:hypothetical protein